jgi:hypothetical protein
MYPKSRGFENLANIEGNLLDAERTIASLEAMMKVYAISVEKDDLETIEYTQESIRHLILDVRKRINDARVHHHLALTHFKRDL